MRLVTTANKNILSGEMSCLPCRLHESAFEIEHRAQVKTGTQNIVSMVHYQQNPDYIRGLVDKFKGTLQADGFFSLVPALCLNWMDASIQGKEMMHKKSILGDGYYTDDGFAVGLTFCLVVLDQMKQYER